ncbi:hypothetical protein AB0B97_19460 [Micromonospora sp. NPDC049004]
MIDYQPGVPDPARHGHEPNAVVAAPNGFRGPAPPPDLSYP